MYYNIIIYTIIECIEKSKTKLKFDKSFIRLA